MIAKESFSLEHTQRFRKGRRVDPILLERNIYALGLVEALVRVGMPFIFKGGTSLTLLLEKPRRLSTDVDIIVEPGTDVMGYLNEAKKIFPFKEMEEQSRKGKNDIVKQHFKFWYDSPMKSGSLYILLDVLYGETAYSAITAKEITNEFLITEPPLTEVTMPTIDCILGDKLTAFAPRTTGIPFGVDKELEIIKQMYDVSVLTDESRGFSDVRESYMRTVADEIAYRGLTINPEEVLHDTFESASCIATRGALYEDDYPNYLDGIHKIVNYIYSERFSGEKAITAACKVMYISACVMKNIEHRIITDTKKYMDERILLAEYKKLGTLRKLDLEAYAYAVEAIKTIDR